jgi:dolichol-phosphate mannosyltransferase
LFVDDSDDGTPEVIAAMAPNPAFRVAVIHRLPGQRGGGLGGAVLAGIQAAQTKWVCVMDADLQHPPELLRALLEEARRSKADVVVASRYCPGGDVGDFTAARAAVSRSSGMLARMLFPRRLRGVSDPLSGFFLIRRAAVDLTALRPRGFKILLEILVRGGPLTTSEIAFRFGERYAGESKASLREGVRYLHRLIELRVGGPASWNRNGTADSEPAPQPSVLTWEA